MSQKNKIDFIKELVVPRKIFYEVNLAIIPELKLQKIFFVCEEMNVIVTKPNYEL